MGFRLGKGFWILFSVCFISSGELFKKRVGREVKEIFRFVFLKGYFM